MAANISLRTAFSPHALGITFRRLRSSPNRRSSMFVVRIALRCRTGIRRCATQASKSSWKQAAALGNSFSHFRTRSAPRPRAMAREGAWHAARACPRNSGQASSRETLAARFLMRWNRQRCRSERGKQVSIALMMPGAPSQTAGNWNPQNKSLH